MLLQPAPEAAEPLEFDADGYCLIDVDPLTGKTVRIKIEGTRIHVREEMPIDDLLDENAEFQADNLNRPWGDGAIAARVPMHLWQKHLAPAIVQQDKSYVARWLNDADHARFRTRAGRV